MKEVEAATNTDPLTTVLIVDDKPMVLSAAQRLLDRQFEVICASDPSEALDLGVLHGPAVLILDLVIPGHDVFESFKRMRLEEKLQKTRFIGMGIRTMRTEMERARSIGFHDILVKPFKQEALVKSIKDNLLSAEELLTYGEDYAAYRFPAMSTESATPTLVRNALNQAHGALRDIADNGCSRMVLDMTDITLADMSTVACVSSIHQSARNLGIALTIMVPNPSLARILGQFAETNQAPVYGDFKEALAALPA